MKALALVLPVLLSGCLTLPGKPVEVAVPIAVACNIPEVERPIFAVDSLPIGSGIWEQMAALRAERHQRIGYEAKIEAAAKACADPPPGASSRL